MNHRIFHRTRARSGGPAHAAAFLLAATAFGAQAAVENQRVLGNGVQLTCSQSRITELDCDYRLLKSGPVEQVTASIRGTDLPPPEFEPYIEPPSASAVLILVDTSDPARQAVIEKNISHIRRLLETGDAHHRFGLASFDSDLRLLAPLGSSHEAINAAAAGLRAVGMTTELYRSTLQAVRLLANTQAERRALVLMSDGLAEDRAYFHGDVVRAARAAGVVIYGLGYPRSVALSVGLQSIRRLAEETGGPYVPSDAGFNVPDAFFDAPFSVLDNGGRVVVDLEPATEAGLGGDLRLDLAFNLADGRASAAVPIRLPGAAGSAGAPQVRVVEVPKVVEIPKVVEVEKLVTVPSGSGGQAAAPGAPAPVRAPESALPASLEQWLWYAVIPGALLISLLLVLVLVLRSRREPAEASGGPPRSLRTLAFLESYDGGNERHPVTSAAFRIGRHSDNDLTIRDSSISRSHAEIHRKRDGSFTISDLDSMNGVFVNQEKVDSVSLADGDIVEIGDKAYRFVVKEDAEIGGEDTVMLKTVTPLSPLPEVQSGRR